jgi:hypothetical protein
VFNTTEGWQSLKDSHSIRAATLNKKVRHHGRGRKFCRGAQLRRCGGMREVALLNLLFCRLERAFTTICQDPAQATARPGGALKRVLRNGECRQGADAGEGHRKLNDELRRLRKEERHLIVEAIEAARAMAIFRKCGISCQGAPGPHQGDDCRP